MTTRLPDGFQYLPEYFDRTAQTGLLAAVTNAAIGGMGTASMAALVSGPFAPITVPAAGALGAGTAFAMTLWEKMNRIEGGNFYGELRKMEGANGEKLDIPTAARASNLYSAPAAALELVSFGILTKPFIN